MPKGKSKRDSDSSDSGPDDIQPTKKPKTTSKSSSSSRSKDEDDSWSLDQRKFIKVREFKGKIFVDIREYYESDGELKPGKKGIALSPAQWNKLKDVMEEIDESIKSKA